MVRWMPVKAGGRMSLTVIVGGQPVADHGEGDLVQHVVDRSYNVFPIVTDRTVADGETARDEVVLDVDHDEGTSRPQDLLDPIVPTDLEFLLVQQSVGFGVEDIEYSFNCLGLDLIIGCFFCINDTSISKPHVVLRVHS